MSEALVQPVWLPPRTTLGAPNTMKSPAVGGLARGLLVDRKFGDRRRPARERPAASPGCRRHARASGPRPRAPPAPAARSMPARRRRAADHAFAPARRTPRRKARCARPCGCAFAAWRGSATVESMWSLKANRSMRPSDSHSIDFAFGIEIVGLVAQMEAGVGGELRPHAARSPRAAACALSPLRRPGSHDQVVA